jgi:hypothetical protein
LDSPAIDWWRWTGQRSLRRAAAAEQRRRASGNSDSGEEGAGLNHVLHGELPCDLGKALSSCLGSGNRRRGELDDSGPAAAGGTRVPAIVLPGLLNKQLGEVLWCTRKSLGAWVSEDGDWEGVHTGRRQWRTAAARVEACAREGRPGLAYMHGGGRLG